MANTFDGMSYKAPNGDKSSIDKGGDGTGQLVLYKYVRKALTDLAKDRYFMQLASTEGLPMHSGKEIKKYQYIPLLDDRNKNDQGLDAKGAKYDNGNLYGSSRDIGLITERLPEVDEYGGRVNRVGFTRIERSGTIKKLGFFYEWTQEMLQFDSDAELDKHLSRELMNGANQLTEAVLQIDILNGAGVHVFPGSATQKSEVTGNQTELDAGTATVVTYDDLRRLDDILTENRCELTTQIITGTRNIDTKTVSACRVAYVSRAIRKLLEDMTDKFGNKLWIPVHQYAGGTTLLRGEIGSIGSFRFIEVPEMLHWAAEGATVTDNPGFRTATKDAGEKYNVYPILVVGKDSFNSITFLNGGKAKTNNFKIIKKSPGIQTADRNDPYGETGLCSIKWYYGTIINRPERIGILYTVAPE